MTIPASENAERQRRHYDRVAERYAANLGYPHTREYMRYLDSEFVGLLPAGRLGVVVELCCGTGEAYALVADRADYAVGVIRACACFRPTPRACLCKMELPTWY